MARTRLLKPGFFQNEQLADLPMSARLLFAGLWTIADRAGRLEDRPKRIKALLFPFDADVEMDDLLAGLCRGGFIRRYEAEQVAVIQIVRFLEHQKPHKNEPPSALPKEFKDSGQVTTLPPGLKNPVSRSGVKDRDDSSEADEPPAEPVMEFPCVGQESVWALSPTQLGEWVTAYSTLDVLAECGKAREWLLANGNRRKTSGGMPRFLVNWLNRAVDRRGPVSERRQPERRTEPSSYEPFRCPHQPPCDGRWRCHQRTEMDAMRAADRAATA